MRENLLFETDIFFFVKAFCLFPVQKNGKIISAASTAIIITHTGTKKFGARKNQCLSYRYWALGSPGPGYCGTGTTFLATGLPARRAASPRACPSPPVVVAGKAGRGGRARVGHTECAVYGNSVVVVFIQPIKPLSLGWTIEERRREVRKDV